MNKEQEERWGLTFKGWLAAKLDFDHDLAQKICVELKQFVTREAIARGDKETQFPALVFDGDGFDYIFLDKGSANCK